jgi:hypothetical protein
MAIEHDCPIITRNGKGNWYIKGKGLSIDKLKDEIKKNTDTSRHTDVMVCYLIEK